MHTLPPSAITTHVGNFTGYMQRVLEYVETLPKGLRILDIPAGNGLLSARLREMGHTAVCGDINVQNEHYVYVDMEQRLPFDDDSFDLVICLEGIEHMLEPARLAAELSRVCKADGRVIVSTPNVLSFYSRLSFLFTGHHYMFAPHDVRPAARGADRGHVSPASYTQLCYWFGVHGCEPLHVMGDKWKRAVLLPLYGLLFVAGYLQTRAWFSRLNKPDAHKKNTMTQLHSPAMLFSRSLVLVFSKSGVFPYHASESAEPVEVALAA
jgi:SAM-dependent methyltransferase